MTLPRLVSPVYAQCDPGVGGERGINLSDCLQLSDGSLVSQVYESPAFLVNLIVRNLFVLAAIVLFFMVIFAGIKFIQGDKKGVDEASKMLGTAVLGFMIMFSAYWIVQIIKLVTGADIIL